jgi:hypothetical protein
MLPDIARKGARSVSEEQKAKDLLGSIFQPEKDEIGEFPASYKKYRVIEPFAIYAHSEEQALQRWEFFKSVLEKLAFNGWHRHDLVTFVEPWGLSNEATNPEIEFVEELVAESFPIGSMASGELPEWAWLAPAHDKDWNASHVAYRIFAGKLDEEDGEALVTEPDDFWMY